MRPAALVLRCARSGIVEAVLRNDFALDPEPRVGFALPTLVERGSMRKALDFLAKVRRNDAVTGCELLWGREDRVRRLWFAGASAGDGSVLVATGSSGELGAACAALPSLDAAYAPAAERLSDAARVDPADDEDSLLDELGRLYGDFSRLHREGVRRNAELEAAIAERDRLLSVAAHDLRSPLGAIANFATILSEDASDGLDEGERSFLARIEESSRYMLRVIEGLLELRGPSLRGPSLEIASIDLGALVRSAIDAERAVAERAEVSLELVLVGGLPMVEVDPRRLAQVIHHLVENAIRFSPSKTTVVVEALADDESFQVRVEDQGPGIPEHEIGSLFLAFERTSVRPAREAERSSGLGLAIARSIVEAHGGTIRVDTKPGRGSVFSFEIPLAPRR